MEAENYLATGYGTRVAIEAKSDGWVGFSKHAKTTQPPRLKGIVVSPDFGWPYLSATQVFDLRPISRRWIALEKIADPKALKVADGQILVTRSGDVGRATIAHSVHAGHVVSDDLLRISALTPDWGGWIYAYLRAPTVRQMMKAAQYGHIIKHLETAHIDALPLVVISSGDRKRFNASVQEILSKRNQAHALTLEAEREFETAFGAFAPDDFGEGGFVGRASEVFSTRRRRFDAWHHNPSVGAITGHLSAKATSWQSIADLGFKVWLPTRFRRIPAEDGIPFVDSSDLFEINPDITKRIADQKFGDPYNARVKSNWLLLARSGQIYGVNGSVMMSGICHENKVVSDHIIRIAPLKARCRLGYLMIAMTHPTLGRPRVKALPYGSSIPEIEVTDVEAFQIPRLSPRVESKIADCAEKAALLRNEADVLENTLADEAESILSRFLTATS